jgi:antagonist of KipI
MSLIVLDPGLESRIVDMGRPRTRSLGVPIGGAADRRSLALGNALVGNPPDAPALEMTLKGPRLRAKADVGCVLFGAPFEARFGFQAIAAGRTFTLPKDEELQIGGTNVGARAYLCVRGGFDAPVVLASRSALDPIKKNDVLPCAASEIAPRYSLDVACDIPDAPIIAVTPGLQASWFDDSEFYAQSFSIRAASNRMGLRLQGKSLTLPQREMMSEPVCPGAVQVTPDGQCIVLGVDGQTIGGYPKIAQVIQADLDTLGQLRPGQLIEFKKITLEEAIERDRHAAASLRESVLRLQLSLDAMG